MPRFSGSSIFNVNCFLIVFLKNIGYVKNKTNDVEKKTPYRPKGIADLRVQALSQATPLCLTAEAQLSDLLESDMEYRIQERRNTLECELPYCYQRRWWSFKLWCVCTSICWWGSDTASVQKFVSEALTLHKKKALFVYPSQLWVFLQVKVNTKNKFKKCHFSLGMW